MVNTRKLADHYYVLGQLVHAVEMLVDSNLVYTILPEIRSNLVMARISAESIQQVAGIPGRLTEVFGRITAPAYPAWGASKNTSRILLSIMKHNPKVRAVMEIKYSAQIIDLLKENNILCAELIINGDNLGDLIKGTINDGVIPSIFYIQGGLAREGATIVTGKDAVTVAETVIKIADLLNKDAKDTREDE
ncbi:MAG TPA: thiamine-phosphate synthase family protein [Desulfosporosinus sp.]|nr:thiamine-phosphate synthase family protein [Desulfosporosinus sp.]